MRARGLLTLALASGAVLALGGGALALLGSWLQLGKRSLRGRHVMAAVGRAMLDGSLPGSLFPTSAGANPQLSICAFLNRPAQGLARRLTGPQVTLA